MNESPYTPPVAPVADVNPRGTTAAPPAFFPVSIAKLVLMTFGTLGLYQYFWIYENWKLEKQRTGESIWPLPRAIFAVFFIYQLLRRIDAHAERAGARRVAAGPIAALWIILTLLWKLPDPYWLVTFLAVFALLPVQQAVNDLNRLAAPGYEPNAKFRGWNWLAIVIGVPFFALAVFGAFLPPE
ncbi:MAG TPA: hypothetical protein VG873_13360 [Burkholderiales bacterium]|nr:hypothetical protein [Burkholderiales bacterium]